MKKVLIPILLALTCITGTLFLNVQAQEDKGKKLRILLVAGGCCHDYATQTQLLKDGIESRIPATVDIAYNPDTTVNATFDIYQSENWAQDFDLIIHDECSAGVTDVPYVQRILKAHLDGKPAVNLHCAMHSYRWGEYKEPVQAGADNAQWFEMIGLQSASHGPKTPIDIIITNPDHPITKGMEGWTTIDEELYNNVQIFPTATPLISGNQLQPPRAAKGKAKAQPDTTETDSKPIEANAVIAWTNLYGPNQTRIFSTSLGHQNDTVADARYLDLLVRGIRWASSQD
jgi:type 1 glutamine amidotransferase